MKASVKLDICKNTSMYFDANITEDMDLENIKKSALLTNVESVIKSFFKQYSFGYIDIEDIDKKDLKLFKDDLVDILAKFTKVISVDIIYEIPTNGQKAES